MGLICMFVAGLAEIWIFILLCIDLLLFEGCIASGTFVGFG